MIKITIISAGPIMDPEIDKYKALSEYFVGDIITASSIRKIIERKNIYNFNNYCLRYFWNKKGINIIILFLFCMKYAFTCRLHGNNPQIVTSYDPLKTGLFGILIARMTGAKFVPEVNGVYNKVIKSNEIKGIFKIKYRLFPLLQKIVLNNAQGIKLLFDTQIDDIKLSSKKRVIKAFPCYVNVDSYIDRSEYAEKNEILFVGFPFWIKGVDVLIKAFKMISDRNPSWTLKILGWYPDRSLLDAHIEGHRNIIVHKPVYPEQMPEHICSCSIFVLPSRTEAMGRVLVEAMAAGKARIGADVDGVPTVINDGVDGLLFEREDYHDLSKKMELLIRDRRLRNRLGFEGKKRALKEFTKNNYAENMYSFMSEICG